MVISNNHNLYFKIQCKKSKDRITIHFLIYLILPKIHTTIYIWKSLQKYVFPLFNKKFNQNTTKTPCFVEMKSNIKIKFVVYKNRIYSFLLQNTYISFIIPKLCV
jgi:hypothetical protein